MSRPFEILLLGGGHTHLTALEPLANMARGRVGVALMAPEEELLYSGMMPGWMAGQYRFAQCAIPLRRWCEAAGVRWIADRAVDVDFPGRTVHGASGQAYRYDLLSLNVGSENALGAVEPEVADRVLGAKPFAGFVSRWQAQGQFATGRRCVVVGGGAAGVEIALALRASGVPEREILLISGGPRLLEGMARGAGERARRALAARRVGVRLGVRYVGASAAGIALSDGSVEPFDCAIVATGARPPGWLSDCARRDTVEVTEDGGVAVGMDMASTSRPDVFASGDCASFVHRTVPKSGVYALKQGPVLARALAHAGGLLQDGAAFRPQSRALALLNLCDGAAIGAWGPIAFEGAWVWRWKDRIDRRFMARFGVV